MVFLATFILTTQFSRLIMQNFKTARNACEQLYSQSTNLYRMQSSRKKKKIKKDIHNNHFYRKFAKFFGLVILQNIRGRLPLSFSLLVFLFPVSLNSAAKNTHKSMKILAVTRSSTDKVSKIGVF